MPTVANYRVVSDNPFTISTSGDRDRDVNFNIPVEHLPGGNDLVQWRVNTRSANDLRFRVSVNDTTVLDYGPSDENLTRDFLEVAVGVVDGANNIRFNIFGGSGSVDISDIIVWYQLNV